MRESDELELVRVRDGRAIAVSRFGHPDGRPCLYFHGRGSSRLEATIFDAAAREHGVGIVSLDRPGVGRSDPRPDRTLPGWAGDATDVADALGFGRFVVAGWSAGGAHALACASQEPDRIFAAVPINPATPAGDDPGLLRDLGATERLFVFLALRAPRLWERYLSFVSRFFSPEKMRDPRQRQKIPKMFPAADRALMSDPDRIEWFIRATEEGTRQGPRADIQDMRLLYGRQGWGFDPYSVSVPVEAFVGEEDSSLGFVTRLAAANGRVRTHTFPGAHNGFLADRVLDEVCKTMASA